MNLFSIEWENPLGTWWKARKHFRMPTPKFHFFVKGIRQFEFDYPRYPFMPPQHTAAVLDVYGADVGWKDKWREACWESSPIMWVCLFNLVGFVVTFEVSYVDELGQKDDGDLEYWEYLLDYLYYHKNLIGSLPCYHRDSRLWYFPVEWGDRKKGTKNKYKQHKYVIPVNLFALNKRGTAELLEKVKAYETKKKREEEEERKRKEQEKNEQVSASDKVVGEQEEPGGQDTAALPKKD